jgi:hypothetical protein
MNNHVPVVTFMLKQKFYDEQNFNSIVLDCVLSDRINVPMLAAFYKECPIMFTVRLTPLLMIIGTKRNS